MDQRQAQELLEKYNQGKASQEEIRLLENWYAAESAKQQADPENEDYQIIQSEIWDRIQAQRNPQHKTIRLWPRIAAAASIILCLSAGGYYLLHKQPATLQTAQDVTNDVIPGSNKAILTLANGKKIVITGASNGAIATQANMVINKTAEGKLNYQQTGDAQAEPMMNTLATQMGGETSLTLADGTEVKLDAASSITYPVAFNGKERKVTVTGQAYFKVKHKAEQPFIVTAGGQTIRDIGTEFNINSYSDIKTTLVEGSISVNNKILVPGQQALLQNSRLFITEGDPEEAAAWAKGYFRFNNEDIHTVMDKIKRWYNIDVAFNDNITNEKFTGKASRYKNISQVFYMLGYSQKVHFKIEGRRVTVMK